MMRYDNNVEQLISVDALRRMMSIPAGINTIDERLPIAAACGLMCVERIEE